MTTREETDVLSHPTVERNALLVLLAVINQYQTAVYHRDLLHSKQCIERVQCRIVSTV